MSRKLEVVLFDAVGTLIFPQPTVAEIYHHVGSAAGSQFSKSELSIRFHEAFGDVTLARTSPQTNQDAEMGFWREVVARVFSDVQDTGEIFDQLWNHFESAHAWELYEDVHDTLTSLADCGLAIGIASNFDDRLLEICGMIERWCPRSMIFHSVRVGYRKPSGGFFQTIQEWLGLAADQLALVGDDPVADVRGASESGWRAIHLCRTGLTHAAPAVRSIETLRQLPRVLALNLHCG